MDTKRVKFSPDRSCILWLQPDGTIFEYRKVTEYSTEQVPTRVLDEIGVSRVEHQIGFTLGEPQPGEGPTDRGNGDDTERV